MSAVPKKRLCWHCEGSIDRTVDNCPYCGVYVHSTDEDDASTWTPPFNLKILSKEKNENSDAENKSIETNNEEIEKKNPLIEQLPSNDIKKDVLPIILLLMGSGFFLFGIVLLLFSHEGTLTLKWNGDNWIYFILVALPSLFFGWRFLSDD